MANSIVRLISASAVFCLLLAPCKIAAAAMTLRITDCLDSANTHALVGQHVKPFVYISSETPVGRANIRVRYAFPGLTFLGATATGQFSQWEHFTWSHQADTLFPDSGYGTIDLTAVADLENGVDVHPDPADLLLDGRVVQLHFWISNNLNLGNQCPAVLLSDFECGQCVLRSEDGLTAYVPAGSETSCAALAGQTTFDVIQIGDGSVCIHSLFEGDGDLNLDGIENNIADAVLFCRYFVLGDEVWDPVWEDVQILATDVNDDGIVCTVGDLVFLIKLIESGGTVSYGTGGSGDCW